MAIVAKKNKKKTPKKSPATPPTSKFISQALVNRRKKTKGKKKKRAKTRGMIFIKNLPHGFFEEQLRGFFSQFGSITRLRLGRSKKTLNSRGYAFIEFRYPEVAEIAAESINNYLMFKRIIKAKYIPPSAIKHDYFRSSIFKVRKENGEKEFTSNHIQSSKMNVEMTNRLMTDDDQKKRKTQIQKKLNKKMKNFADLGMDFDLQSAVADNLGIELKKPSENETIANLNDTELDDEADETFDPTKMDLQSDDDIEEFDNSNSDESEDEVVVKSRKAKAIETAIKVSKEKKSVVAEKKAGKPAKKEVKNVPKKSVEKPTKPETKIVVDKPQKKSAAKKEKPAKKVVEKPAKKEAPKLEKPASKKITKTEKPAMTTRSTRTSAKSK